MARHAHGGTAHDAPKLVELRDCIRHCGYECRGRSVPEHLCESMVAADGR
jgi:hypothetical protein